MAPTPPIRSPELERALDARPDADALRRTWDALPTRGSATATATATDATRTARQAAAWARLTAQLDDPQRVPFVDDVPAPLALHEPPASTAPARSSRIVYAMAATLVLSVGSLAWWRATPVRYQAAPSVASTSIALGDGSVVSLAGGASLTVPRSLGWPAFLRSASRDVQLQGVAFFTVARDGRPFIVHTTDAAVRVLGTRFEVRGPTAVSGTRVAVEEGRVQVTARPTRQAVTLGAGDRTVIGAAALTVTTVAPDRVATWREGGLAAVDEPLGVVLAELARRYETPITLVDAVAARAMVSLFYTQAPTLETVLTDLCTAQGLRFSRTSDGYVVQRAP